jgi:hypothetical protein
MRAMPTSMYIALMIIGFTKVSLPLSLEAAS